MTYLTKNKSRFLVLILISLVIFVLWQYGFQTIYAKFLTAGANLYFYIVGSDTSIAFNIDQNKPTFWIFLVIDGQQFRFPQELGALLQPTVMILAWQLFLFFVLKPLHAFKLLGINLVIFIAIQFLFIIQLTGYHTSNIQKFIYEFLVGNFYVIALILIIKDNIFNPVFRLKPKQ